MLLLILERIDPCTWGEIKMVLYDKNGWPYSDELYHHGILGQKWGVRRYQNLDGSLTSAGKARYGDSGKTEKQIRREAKLSEKQEWKARKKEMLKDSATVYKMTDKEILEKIGRLEREKRLMDLTYERLTSPRDPYANMMVKSGKKIVENFIAGAGAYTLNSLTGMIPSVGNKGNKVFDAKQFANWAFPNPNQKKK